MPRQRTATSLRNGHFKMDGTTANTGRALATHNRAKGYRIFNSGENAVDVSANSQTRVLNLGCSIDVQHSEGPIFVENTVQDKAIEGSYLSFDPNLTPRVGRTIRRAIQPNNDIYIVERESTAGPYFYRIVNSGAAVKIGNPNYGVTAANVIIIPSRCSLDITTAGRLRLSTVNDNRPLRCVYTLLRPVDVGQVLAGRFSRRNNADQTQAQVVISNATGSTEWYRITNTGNQPFSVGEGTVTGQAGSNPFIDDLGEGQSADFPVASGQTIAVWVNADDIPIKGVYDYLGDD